MMTYLAFAIAGLATFLLRSSPTLAAGVVRRARVETWIRFVSPAALAAIVAGALLIDDGAVEAPTLAEGLAVAAAATATRFTKNVAVSLAAGLPVFWIASALTAA